MKFVRFVDGAGRRHIVNPCHVAAVHETETGCEIRLCGAPPIILAVNQRLDIVADALEACEKSSVE